MPLPRSEATGREAPVNQSPVNQEALRFLRQAQADADPSSLFLAQLAMWGLDHGIQIHQLDQNHPSQAAVETTIGLLLNPGRAPAANSLAWLLRNPNLSRAEQQNDLLERLRQASNPWEASKVVLEAVYARMVAAS